jgi:DNA repair protein RecO (recombination protein O)
MRGVLLSFHPLRLSFGAASALGNLFSAEWAGALQPLAGQALMCGFYLNELLLKLVPREDPHEALFDAYADALSRLGDDSGAVLRRFERRLLAELGYAPLLERDAASRPIDPEALYVYEPERGPVRVNGARGDVLVIRGRTLLDVAADDYSSAATREEARELMRALIGERLHGQVLHTRTVLRELSDL